jgi:hypothetical protein
MRLAALAFVILAPSIADAATLVFANPCPGNCTFTGAAANDSVANTTTVFSGVRSLTGFPHGDATFDATVDCLSVLLAPFDIAVVTIDPSPTPHTEIAFAGTPQQASLPSGVDAIAPAACAHIPNAPGFVFAASLPADAQRMCELAASQVAAMAGLEPLHDCRDVMSYLPRCGTRTFLDAATQCGTFSPAACTCGGTTRNSFAVMRAVFGAADPVFQDGFE